MEGLSGRPDEADERLRTALRVFQETADVSGYTLVLDSMAALALRRGDTQRAATIAGSVDSLERTSGTGLSRSNRAYFGYDPGPLRTGADTAAAFAAGAAMDTQAALAFALSEDGPG